MKIAIFTETFLPSTDGIVTRLCASLDLLMAEGHQLLIFAPNKGVTQYRGAKVVGIPGIPLFIYPDKQISFFSLQVRKELARFQPDVIHVVNPVLLGIMGVYYAKKMKLPLVASYHTHIAAYADYYRVGFLKPLIWGHLKTLHNRAQLNLCTSLSTLRELERRGIKRLRLWGRGVNRERFGRRWACEAMRSRLSGGNPGKKIFLYVGRLGFEKELDRLRPVLDRNPEIALAFVGDGPARKTLERIYAGTNTVFTGFLHGEELNAAYASSDAFIFPSTTETLGLVLMEAMASGLPIIAAKSGPTCEILSDGVSALLFDPGDQEAMLRAVELLAADDHKRTAMGEAAYLASEGLDWRKPTQQLLGYYQEAIRSHQRVSVGSRQSVRSME